MEQRRLLLAFGLSILLLIVYQELVVKRYRRPASEVPASAPELAAHPAGGEEPEIVSDLAVPADRADAEQIVSIETDVLRLRLTKVGARLASLELIPYRRSVDPQSEPLELVTVSPVLPLTLQLGAETSDAGVIYQADQSNLVLHGTEAGEIRFVADSPRGLHLEKHFKFTGAGYLFEVSTTATGQGSPATVGLVLASMPLDAPTRTGHEVAIALAGRRLVEKPLTDLQKQPVSVPDSQWAGFAAQYFLTAAMPSAGGANVVMTSVGGLPLVRIDAPVVDGGATFSVYAGPKDREVLARTGHDLDRALDFGWFWFIAIPLLRALRALHALTGNYGIAIIVLTTLVKLATVPLTQTTFRNMREMQKIQPQMAKLRERFKDDQTNLQKEMMELYRRHRVNPLSGCLPMVLQLPIFVGLYNALLHAIELRHAPFTLWINDLSAPDRLMVAGVGVPVLTLLMGASMFLQQRLSPQQGDPAQQRMMMFMPAVFTFMFINFPAGLVLYWLVNNVLSIGQQYLMLRAAN